jgi:hypothetical protein
MKTLSKNRIILGFVMLPMLALMSGCGGGSGGGSGASTTSPIDSTPPAVINTTPALNAANVAPNSAITVTFSESIDPATVNGTTFAVAGVSGTVTYDDTNKMATFRPASVLANNAGYTVTVSTGVKDVAGNAMAQSYSWSFTTSASLDNIPPTVSSTVPANGATNVATNSSIAAIFSEGMNASSIVFTLKQGTTAIPGSVTYTAENAAVTFTPSASLAPNTTFTATVSGADLAGNTIASPYSWSFTTAAAPDTTPPTVVSVYPADGATGVPVTTTLSVTFSEPMLPFNFGTVDGVPATVTWSNNNTTAVLTPGANLKSSAIYTFTISAKDLAGNQMTTPYAWKFTTQ